MPFDLKAGIVGILAKDGKATTGTGFILSEKGIIATCSHVVQPEKLQVRGYPRWRERGLGVAQFCPCWSSL
jgi:hypothetical protein